MLIGFIISSRDTAASEFRPEETVLKLSTKVRGHPFLAMPGGPDAGDVSTLWHFH